MPKILTSFQADAPVRPKETIKHNTLNPLSHGQVEAARVALSRVSPLEMLIPRIQPGATDLKATELELDPVINQQVLTNIKGKLNEYPNNIFHLPDCSSGQLKGLADSITDACFISQDDFQFAYKENDDLSTVHVLSILVKKATKNGSRMVVIPKELINQVFDPNSLSQDNRPESANWIKSMIENCNISVLTNSADKAQVKFNVGRYLLYTLGSEGGLSFNPEKSDRS